MSAPQWSDDEARALLAQMQREVEFMHQTIADLRRAGIRFGVALPLAVIFAVAVTLWLR